MIYHQEPKSHPLELRGDHSRLLVHPDSLALQMVQQFDVSCHRLSPEVLFLVFSSWQGIDGMSTLSAHSGDKDDGKVGDLSQTIDLVTCKKKNKEQKEKLTTRIIILFEIF